MTFFTEYYGEQERKRKKRKKKKKKNKLLSNERDENFVKLLQNQQVLHLADCDETSALKILKDYKKQKQNDALVDDIKTIWKDEKLAKDKRLQLATIRIFAPERYQSQRKQINQGNASESTPRLNEQSRYIIESLIISALELPFPVWPYWQNINKLTLPTHFRYFNQSFAEGNKEYLYRRAGSGPQNLEQLIIKSAEELGAKPIGKDKTYWVKLKHEISYPDDKGQIEPAKNSPYVLTLPDGKKEKGILDAKGQARHDGLKTSGQCTVEYEPDIEEKIEEKQAEIKKILDDIIKAEQQETLAIEKKLENAKTLGLDFPGSNTLARAEAYKQAARKGAWKAAKGMGEMAYEASQYLNPVTAPFKFKEDIVKLKANYDSLKNITDDEIETYSALMGDADTYSLFMGFSKDYVKAQHSLEITEAGGMAAFEIAVIVITAGAGAAASVRHLGKLGKLKPLMGDLVKLLKRKRAKKSVSGDNNKTLESKNELKKDGAGEKKTKLKPGTPAHKADRWERYKKRDGKYSYERWSKQYDTNMRNYKHGLKREVDYRKAMDASEGTVKTPFTNRQIDILKAEDMYAGQLKTGPVSLSKENILAIKKDAELVKRGWEVEHILEKGATKPYIQALDKAGIKYHIGNGIPN